MPRRILKPKGVLTLIWRADGLAEVLSALDRLRQSRDTACSRQFYRAGDRILIRAIKGERAPMQIHASLLLNDASGVPNKWVQEILAGEGTMS
jgi:tRNA1(Val) A37 N6-methylase TrmN6